MSRQAEAIVEAVRAAGVVGAGGAGFPSHLKLQSQAEVVIANGCECEPLLCSDQYLMEHEPQAIVQGLLLAMQATGARLGVIALKEKYSRPLAALKKAVCGYPSLKFQLLSNHYPLGDEQLLTYLAAGRLVPGGGIPAQVGVLVHNVTTLAQIARACEGEAVTRRRVAVLGEVSEPKLLEAPLGTPVQELISWAGGARSADVAVIAGGPMMGQLIADLSLPLTKTTSALLVLPAHHPLVIKKKKSGGVILRQARASCQFCGSCQQLCPRCQLGHPLKPQRLLRAAGYYQPLEVSHVSGVLACSQCGACSFYACPMGLMPSVINSRLRQKAKRNSETRPAASSWPYPLGIPAGRLLHRLSLSKYNFPLFLDEQKYSPRLVRLPLKQHVGEAAVPLVKAGDRVQVGDLLAEIPREKPAARVHASIDGWVKSLAPGEILLTA